MRPHPGHVGPGAREDGDVPGGQEVPFRIRREGREIGIRKCSRASWELPDGPPALQYLFLFLILFFFPVFFSARVLLPSGQDTLS